MAEPFERSERGGPDGRLGVVEQRPGGVRVALMAGQRRQSPPSARLRRLGLGRFRTGNGGLPRVTRLGSVAGFSPLWTRFPLTLASPILSPPTS
jgi:hypothetical protein